MSWQIQESINIGHRDLFWTIRDFYDVIARTNFPFLQHAKVESWSVMFYEQRRHTRLAHANADAVACHARLCHFECRVTNAVAIANAHLVIGKSLDGEVFSELSKDEVMPPENAFPVVIGAHLINKNGALLSTMAAEIALRIANNIERPHPPSAFHWRFPDRGMDGLTVPCHVAWKTDI